MKDIAHSEPIKMVAALKGLGIAFASVCLRLTRRSEAQLRQRTCAPGSREVSSFGIFDNTKHGHDAARDFLMQKTPL